MANLTQQEFFDIADLYPEGINIWCTEATPVTVLGVTVPFADNEGNSVENTLEQVQTITLPVDNDPGATVELQITSRVIRGTVPFRYYFFTVEPRNITPYISYIAPALNEVVQDGEVILLPNLRGGSFYVSDYNVILNTAQDNRLSDYILRDTSTTFAAVQDSLYSDTGWINARYEGTTTNNLTYSSIDSAILGASLQGTYYPLQTPDAEINNVDVAERTYLEYFHNSLETYPVARGWNNTPKQTLSANDQLFKIQSIRMFELEGSKPSPVKQGKIRLKDTGYIAYTDLLGYLVSGSTPPII